MNRQEMMQQHFNGERSVKLAQTEFEWDWTSIKPFLRKALEATSCHKSGLPFGGYKRLVQMNDTLFMPEVTVLINILLGASASELGQTLEENCEFIESLVMPILDQWKDIDHKLSEKIANTINARSRIQGPDGKTPYPAK